jgi:hypothetical protein
MAHVVTDLDSTASPERVIEALTDFSPRRFDLWPNIDRDYFRVNEVGTTSADVTEGSGVFGGVWERGRYDWSHPGTVRIDVIDSNAFQPGSYWHYDVSPRSDGGSHVHMEFDRRPRNWKGRLVGAVLTLVGARLFTRLLGQTLRRVEQS